MELALVLHPILVNVFPVLVVEGNIVHADFFVVERSSALKLILFPVSLVGLRVVGIVQSAFSVHLVFLPFSDVLSSLVVVKYTVSMSHIIEFGAFVLPFKVCLRDVLVLLARLVNGILDGCSTVVNHATLLF